MTFTSRMRLCQAQGPDNLIPGATLPWRPASSAGRWHDLTPGGLPFTSVGLGMEHAH